MGKQKKNSIIIPEHKISSLEVKTGDWRTFKPEFKQKNSACYSACPAKNRIRDLFQLAKDGKFEEAWQKLIETNPLPAVLGRICPYPCESKCLREELDESLAINAFERHLGDLALRKGWRPSGFKELMPRLLLRHRIAIIGAGPAGLSAAYQLRRMGHWVDIFEAEKAAGGMLYFGIPEYRLSKKILIQEIENNIFSLKGIEIHYGIAAERLLWYHFYSDFDAVLIATGRSKSRKLNIEGEENPQVISGLNFLKKINLDRETGVGAIVAVVGAGNTAIDAARSAKMKGAKHVFILYRRTEQDMPAFKEEIEAAKKEGVEVMPLLLPATIEKRCDGLLRIECFKVGFGEFDETGRPKPMPRFDSSVAVFTHNLIVAIGEEPDLSFVAGLDEGELPPENVFVAGDASIYGAGTVASAIGSGNKIAQEIDFYLRNGARMELIPDRGEVVQFSDLNREYFEFRRSMLRRWHLNHLYRTLDESMKEEAERCFSCGDCNSCGNCWIFCPDIAVKEMPDGKFEINYDYCKGCGICANECPRHVIDMKLEEKSSFTKVTEDEK